MVISVKYLTFRRFRRVLVSVSVEEARLRGLRGTSCVMIEPKLDLEALLFHRCNGAVVISR